MFDHRIMTHRDKQYPILLGKDGMVAEMDDHSSRTLGSARV